MNTCQIPECRRPTNERKPYCIEHLDRLGYVKDLKVRLARREAEEDAARRRGWRAVNPSGSRACEILDQLAVKGAQTPRRLAITVAIRPRSLDSYIGALARAGLVELLTLGSRRGSPRRVVALTEEGFRRAVPAELELAESAA